MSSRARIVAIDALVEMPGCLTIIPKWQRITKFEGFEAYTWRILR
jgi:hypothetical protein